MKYAWITQHRDSFPVAVLCDVLLVSTSGYYGSLGRQPSSRAERHQRIRQAVRDTSIAVVADWRQAGVVANNRAPRAVSDVRR